VRALKVDSRLSPYVLLSSVLFNFCVTIVHVLLKADVRCKQFSEKELHRFLDTVDVRVEFREDRLTDFIGYLGGMSLHPFDDDGQVFRQTFFRQKSSDEALLNIAQIIAINFDHLHVRHRQRC